MNHRGFAKTQALFERASRVVPAGIYGHQSPAVLVPGAYPYFFDHGAGSHVWDVDGNEYIDYICSYGPIVLGHNHPKVEEAAAAQRRKGNCFNGPTELWVELAEYLVDLVPFADWAVFAKNGSDVCTWSVELAREFTGRKKVVMASGAYHGTHAWCTPFPGGTTPEDTANTLTFEYNNLADLERVVAENEGQVAAVIIAPFKHDTFQDQQLPVEGFFQGLRRLCDAKGIIFILDDVRAGFRLHLGGSLEPLGVRPDLACYCKALGNGYPIAACVGRGSLMDAATHVFFTGSYFTSGVPMAAALACLKEMKAGGAIERMRNAGEALRRGIEERARGHRQAITYSGPPAIPFMTFAADQGSFARSRRFCAECCARGVYLHPHHNWFMMAAHTDEDIRRTLEVVEQAFGIVAREFGS